MSFYCLRYTEECVTVSFGLNVVCSGAMDIHGWISTDGYPWICLDIHSPFRHTSIGYWAVSAKVVNFLAVLIFDISFS